MGIGKKLKLIRNKLNLSQEDMASSLGISSRMFRDYEKDKFTLDVDKIGVLINKYNINPMFLFLDTGEILLQQEISKDYLKLTENKYNIKNDELRLIIEELVVCENTRKAFLNLIEKKRQNKDLIKDVGEILKLLMN